MTFTFGSLFSGIGGIDLGLERAGMKCEWQVEIDEYASKVLQKHWPNVARFRDVRECGEHNLATVDLIAGGFPCQPHSLAGERQASEDERDLWPEFYRIIRELKPRWVLAENVLGLLSSEDGAFFGGILRDLAQAGYDAEWFVLRASDIGAPHQRERVFIVAYTRSERRPSIRNGIPTRANNTTSPSSNDVEDSNFIGESWESSAVTSRQCSTPLSTGVCQRQNRAEMANTSSQRCEERNATTFTGEQGHVAWRKIAPGKTGPVEDTTGRREWQHQATRREEGAQSLFEQSGTGAIESLLGRNPDGLSAWMDRYQWPTGPGEQQHGWEPPRVITERLTNRTVRLKVLGNSVVPQLAEVFGYYILDREASV